MVFHEPLVLISALQADLCTVGTLSPESFDRFGQLIPNEWIEQALQATGTSSLRRRRLPAERLIVCPPGRRYLTSLADTARHRADQVTACYRKRWEIELGFREIKQGMLANNLVLRSKRSAMVRQEVWGGLLIAYNLLRREIHQTAEALDVSPTRLSFQGYSTRPSWPNCATYRWKPPVPFPNDSPGFDSKLVFIYYPRDENDRVPANSNDDLRNTQRKMPVSLTDWH
jgi:hypothetical protein